MKKALDFFGSFFINGIVVWVVNYTLLTLFNVWADDRLGMSIAFSFGFALTSAIRYTWFNEKA
jgi:hypothetical protein